MKNQESFPFQGELRQETKYGILEGICSKAGSWAWLGIPYAQPPVGELRWKAPRDLQNWSGVLYANQYNHKCIQRNREEIIGSEDCLYLNIWRPANAEENLPVFVWAHGGGNITGSGEDFQGDILAVKANSIVVSLNYRLGILGWFRLRCLETGNLKDDSGNYGLLDIFKALSWVRENIVSFGGDPNNITLGGHSAGARNVATALISPVARGLFQKLILVSGGRTLTEADQGENFARRIVRELLIQDKMAADETLAEEYLNVRPGGEIASYLRAKKPEEFLSFIGNVEIRMEDFPHLFKDGNVIPAEGFIAIENGQYEQVPIILGCDDTEYGIYNVLDPYWGISATNLSLLNDTKKFQLYVKTLYYGSQLFACLNADSTADLLVKQTGQPPVFVYRLAWGTQEGTLREPLRKLVGASHQVDLDFLTGHETYVLNDLFPGMCYTEQNRPGRAKLTALMMAYLGCFLHTGNPNGRERETWLPWSSGEDMLKTMIWNADAVDAKAQMSIVHYIKEVILAEMQKNLTQEEWKIITGVLLRGRFLMDY